MAKSRREELDDDLARKWLAKHAPKQALRSEKRQPLERWQMFRQQQKQERQALAKPLLKGVE